MRMQAAAWAQAGTLFVDVWDVDTLVSEMDYDMSAHAIGAAPIEIELPFTFLAGVTYNFEINGVHAGGGIRFVPA